MTSSTLAWIFVLVAAVNSTIGNLLLKKSRMIDPSGGFLDMLLQPYFVAGLAFYGINVVLFAKSLEVLKVSVAYPVLATSGFALLIISAHVVIGEQLVLRQYIGVLVLIAGMFLLAVD